MTRTISQALESSSVPASSLIIEITETALMQTTASFIADLERLRARGLSVALDDFGTGYSSLTHLKRFPVDIVKIDRSFIAGLG